MMTYKEKLKKAKKLGITFIELEVAQIVDIYFSREKPSDEEFESYCQLCVDVINNEFYNDTFKIVETLIDLINDGYDYRKITTKDIMRRIEERKEDEQCL